MSRFAVSDPESIRSFIKACPLGTWLTTGAEADFVVGRAPVLATLDGEGRLVAVCAHFAKASAFARTARHGDRATVLLQGPNAYVSASLYEDHASQVPTWNYLAATLRGRLIGPMDRNDTEKLLDALTEEHEAESQEPWSRAALKAEDLASMLDAIVGMTLVVERIEFTAKLSQNRSARDRARVADAFGARGGPSAELVSWMRRLGIVRATS